MSSQSANAWRSIGRLIVSLPSRVLLTILALYRLLISPLYGQVCRYYPSCSAYAVEAITVHGALKGSWLAVKRVGRCNPFSDGGVDHVPPGNRTWPAGREPRIVVLNHPPIPPDPPVDDAQVPEFEEVKPTEGLSRRAVGVDGGRTRQIDQERVDVRVL